MTMVLTKITPNLPKFCDTEFMDRVINDHVIELAESAVSYDIHDLYNVHSVYRDYDGLLSMWHGKKIWFITTLIEVSSGLSFYVISFVSNGMLSNTGLLTRDELIAGFKQYQSRKLWDKDTHVDETVFGF